MATSITSVIRTDSWWARLLKERGQEYTNRSKFRSYPTIKKEGSQI